MNPNTIDYLDPIRKIVALNVESLENKSCFKLICGASLKDTTIIRNLSMLFSLAGANIIDISPDYSSILAARKGIEHAMEMKNADPEEYPDFNEPVLMISINAGEDPHFKTATIKKDLCNQCFKCIAECDFNAISYTETQSISINSGICYGCGKCVKKCSTFALELIENQSEIAPLLTKLIENKIAGIEIHTGTKNLQEVIKFTDILKKNLGNTYFQELLISYSVESGLFNNKDLILYTEGLTEKQPKKPVIQVDGKPMSGSAGAASTLQSLASAQILANNEINGYIILAGGINNLTKKYADIFQIDHHGIAMGTFARKLLWPYLNYLNDPEVFNKALRITTLLVQRMEF